MFERVLLPVDGSEHSERATSVGAELAKKFGSEVLVLNVREVAFMTRSKPIGRGTEEESLSLAGQVTEQLVNDGINAHGKSVDAIQNGAAKQILEEAKEFGATHIVLGTHGHSELTGLLLGSVATKVLHHAECPVTVVR